MYIHTYNKLPFVYTKKNFGCLTLIFGLVQLPRFNLCLLVYLGNLWSNIMNLQYLFVNITTF